MNDAVNRVLIGMDPHKRSVTIEVMMADETILGGGRFGTDQAGFATMRRYVGQFRDRVWAIEGCSGIGHHVAMRLLAAGEEIVDVPPKLSARIRVFATGQGRKTDATDAHSVALVGTRMAGLRPVVNDEQLAVLRMELAHAMLARDLFPDAPLKWMPPTRHMTGDVFRGYLLDGFFNLVGALTGQSILLVGMMTEAVVTPWISDRDLALQNVRYVMNAAGNLHEDFRPAPDGFIAERARQVLGESIELLERILAHEGKHGLLEAIADGTFGLMKRPADAGRGLDGVAKKASGFYNPASELLEGTA